MSARDYYEVLGVPRDVDEPSLKRAYRQIALQYHPDRNPNDADAEARFKEAAEALRRAGRPGETRPLRSVRPRRRAGLGRRRVRSFHLRRLQRYPRRPFRIRRRFRRPFRRRDPPAARTDRGKAICGTTSGFHSRKRRLATKRHSAFRVRRRATAATGPAPRRAPDRNAAHSAAAVARCAPSMASLQWRGPARAAAEAAR